MPAPTGTPGPSLTLSGPLAAAQVPLLCDRLADLLVSSANAAAGDAAAAGDPATGHAEPAAIRLDVSQIVVTLEAVDVLTRLQLTARRLGGCIALQGAPPELVELVEICGLAGILLRPRRPQPDPRPADVPS